jgi:hypothetical protein
VEESSDPARQDYMPLVRQTEVMKMFHGSL